MIRAHELEGRAVVDVDAAEKIGKIDEVILDPDAGQVAAFAVSRGEKLLGGGGHVTVPAWSVQAIGPDALTVRHTAVLGDDAHRFEGLPRLSDVVGRKVVTQSGKLLGTVEDVLINADDARIVGYVLDEQPGPMRKLEALFSGDGKSASVHYVRADANLRGGRELIVAPDEAVGSISDVDLSEPPQSIEPTPPRGPEPIAIDRDEPGY